MVEVKVDDGKTSSRKRARDEFDDSEISSPVSKLARIDSVSSDNDGSGVSSPEAKSFPDDLLSFLDDADDIPAIQDLDSVIRSFEEEILVPEQGQPDALTVSAESMPELGFLLEASDDELGLPPRNSADEAETVDLTKSGAGAVNLGDMTLGFENEMLGYEPCNFGIGSVGAVNVSEDFIGGGLFESFETGDLSEFPWRSETLSAL